MTQGNERERTLALVSYVLHLFGAIAGLPSLVGLVMNYVFRSDRTVESHHDWMIATFWWAILWVVIGAVLTLVLVGWAVLLLAWHEGGIYRLRVRSPRGQGVRAWE